MMFVVWNVSVMNKLLFDEIVIIKILFVIVLGFFVCWILFYIIMFIDIVFEGYCLLR